MKYIRQYLAIGILTMLILAVSVVWYAVYNQRPHGLRFVMLDIGQGDALYIEGPNGTQVIVDGGPGDALLGQLSKVMSPFDRSIDLIINTNPDKDHFEGFIPLLDRYSVGAFMEAGTDASANPLWVELKKKVTDKHIPDIVARRGQRIDLGSGAYIDVLFPDRDVTGLSHNDGSIVAKLVYGKTSVMLTGDSTQIIEKYLLSIDAASLDSDILKVGHHGSKTSTSPEFVQAVSPEIAVMSSGKDNMYGHPNQETLDTLAKNNVEALDTCTMGMISFESDGSVFTLENSRTASVSAGCK
jgi:beta-lactamase superfamily II metal-dependent hydrolase